MAGSGIDIARLQEAEEARRASETRYTDLFNSIDAGFCVCQMILDGGGKPADYRFLEINPRFEEQTGLKNALGRTARELVPDLEEHWFELRIEGDLTRLVQAAGNLLNNAAKYTDEGGDLRIEVARERTRPSSASPTTAWGSPPTCCRASSTCSPRPTARSTVPRGAWASA